MIAIVLGSVPIIYFEKATLMPTYYLMKVKGKAKIPDYIQLRDEHFTLIGYFRPSRQERLSKVIKNEAHAAHIQSIIDETTEYGKIKKVEIN